MMYADLSSLRLGLEGCRCSNFLASTAIPCLPGVTGTASAAKSQFARGPVHGYGLGFRGFRVSGAS